MGFSFTQAFQQEISLNNSKIEQIIVQGEQLIEKSEPLDAAVIEEELDELRRYCQEVFGRVERYHKKLIRLPVCIFTYVFTCLGPCHFTNMRMRKDVEMKPKQLSKSPVVKFCCSSGRLPPFHYMLFVSRSESKLTRYGIAVNHRENPCKLEIYKTLFMAVLWYWS